MTYRASTHTPDLEKNLSSALEAGAAVHFSRAQARLMGARLPEFHQLDWRGYLDDDWDELSDADDDSAALSASEEDPSLEYPYEWVEHIRQMSLFRKQLRQFAEKFRQRGASYATGVC